MKKTINIICAALAVLMITASLCACGSTKKNDKPKIVCTALSLYDFCREIAGEHADVRLLSGSSADYHSYEPTAADILEISSCDIFVYIGGASEKWVDKTLAASGNSNIVKLRTMSLVEPLPVGGHDHDHDDHDEHDHDEDESDEHIWTSLSNAVTVCRGICDTISKADAENKDAYEENFRLYSEKLTALDAEYRKCVSESRLKELVFADRFPFAYLANDYGIECHAAFSGCSSESEASFEVMASLINEVKDKKLPAVIMIEGSKGDIAETVCKATGAKKLVMDSCQLAAAGILKKSDIYYNAMVKNLEVLREALGN